MHAKRKFIVVAGLAAPPLIGGAAGVAAAELPVAAAPASTVTAAADTARPSGSATASPGSAIALPESSPPANATPRPAAQAIVRTRPGSTSIARLPTVTADDLGGDR
jgi:hypothetical protein